MICFCQVILNITILQYLYMHTIPVHACCMFSCIWAAVMLVSGAPPVMITFLWSCAAFCRVHVGVGWKSLKLNFLEHNFDSLKSTFELFFRDEKLVWKQVVLSLPWTASSCARVYVCARIRVRKEQAFSPLFSGFCLGGLSTCLSQQAGPFPPRSNHLSDK